MKTALAIWAITFFATGPSIAADVLEPCETVPDPYFQGLDSRVGAGVVGRRVASITAVPFQGPEWGVLLIERGGTYVARVTNFKQPMLYASVGDRAGIPARIEEFSLSSEIAKRIEAAINGEMAKVQPSDQFALPDNPIFRLSTDGATCGQVTWQSTESIPYKLVRLFMELRCIPDLPRRGHIELFNKLDRLLVEIEHGSDPP